MEEGAPVPYKVVSGAVCGCERKAIVINWSTKDIAGIEFGDRTISAVRVRGKDPGSIVITHAGIVEYDSTSDSKIIAGAVRNLWKKAGMPTRTVCASLRSGSLVMRYFSLPPMTETELKRTLHLKAEEALQLPGHEIVVEWYLNKPAQEGGSQPVTGLLAATPVKDVERELDVLYEAGLDPVILDLRALAVANLYEVVGDRGGNIPVCLVNLSPHAADVMIRRGTGELYPHAIYCRASTWIEAPGFLAENIRDVLRYSEYKLGWESVRQVVLSGTVPCNEEFLGALKEALGIDLKFWDPVSGMSRKSRVVMELLDSKDSPAGLLAPALGLALRRS